MSQTFDELPLYDPIFDPNTRKLTPVWFNFLASFSQTLGQYLSENGMDLPQMTTTQRNAQINPPNGRMIYNTTTNKGQIREAGAWVDLV